MLDLARAEWHKTTGNKWTAGFTIWIFPAGALGVFAFLLLLVLLGVDTDRLQLGTMRWSDQMLMAWQVAAGNIFGHILLSALTAMVFAGESVWNTWKNIVPRQGRAQLILAKFIVTSTLIFIAFLLASIIAGLGSVIIGTVLGQPLTPAPTGETLGAFVGDYASVALLSFVAMLLIMSYAMTIAVATRSILFGVIGGAGAATLDIGSGPLTTLLHLLTGANGVLRLQQVMPSYNLANLQSLAMGGTTLPITAPDGTLFFNSAGVSLLVITVWLVGLLALTIGLFQRRDLA